MAAVDAPRLTREFNAFSMASGLRWRADMKRRMRTLGGLGVAAALAYAGCAGSGADSAGGHAPGSTGVGTGSAGSGTTGGSIPGASTGAGGGVTMIPPPLPPEVEVESSFEVPVATGHFVWIANPTSGRVAYVDATALSVRTVEAGNGPTYLAVVPGGADAVIVLNTLSNDATLLRVNNGTLESRTFPDL